MTKDELLAEKTELEEQLAIVNATIKNVLSRNNKEYEYSNVESTHKHKLQSPEELMETKKRIKDELYTICRQLGCVPIFTQMKS